MFFKLVLVCLVAANLPAVNLLRITELYVPRRAYHIVHIDCKYDLEGGQLYAVKWYKDNSEFMRCAGDGSVLVFPQEDVWVRHSSYASLGSCPATLTVRTPDKASGEYMCEVSLEAPTFRVQNAIKRMDFVSHPEREPQGSEKRTSEEQEEKVMQIGASSDVRCAANLVMLTLVIYLIFT